MTEEEPGYLYLSACMLREADRSPDSLYYDSTEIVPQRLQDESQSKLAVHMGQTPKPKLKPNVAPKPVIEKGSTSNTSKNLSICKGEIDDTSTGDSGFVDVREFRKSCPPTKVASSQHVYKTLIVEQREKATHYTAPTKPVKAQG